jgi:TatD DNase family protein
LITDTHAHLTDPALLENIDEYLRLASASKVQAVLSVGTTLATSRECIVLAEKYPQIRASVGLHPNNCCQAHPGDWTLIERLSQHPRVAALGETGLDRHWDDCPWEVQVDYFRRHLALSRVTNLPVIIHTRECASETLEVLKQESIFGNLMGVMHSFTGPLDVAAGCLELGLYISFAGMATYKNADDIRVIAKAIPDDRILVETDSPYLTPHPLRGKRPNHPGLVVHTVECLAKIRGLTPDEFAHLTTTNAQRLFGKW